MIEPTVGRVVWFQDGSNEPQAAIIAFVHSMQYVTLMVIDQQGYPLGRQNILLIQDDDKPPEDEVYCEWMPYQKGQAAKTEAAEAKLRDAT